MLIFGNNVPTSVLESNNIHIFKNKLSNQFINVCNMFCLPCVFKCMEVLNSDQELDCTDGNNYFSTNVIFLFYVYSSALYYLLISVI